MPTRTGLVLDSLFQRHDPGHGHPERPDRLIAIEQALRERGLTEACTLLPRRPATRDEVLQLHESEYLDRLEHACRTGRPFIDCLDSGICPDSYDVALHAVGAILEATDAIVAGNVRNAFCAVRPPGHHALPEKSMGFCLFNNVAIAADRLIRMHGLHRVLILDWDVHHGNATQAMFESRPDVLYISLHGDPSCLYPGTGWETEAGTGDGEGFTINIPILPGSGDAEYRRAFDERITPAVEAYRPEFVLISTGYDAHRLDPLAPICLEEESFRWMNQTALAYADRWAGGRLLSVLEGGYNLVVLGRCVAEHVEALCR
ncbi:MAG: histone deacetylase [Phycisphaerae bacterium]|nr:histone deacetylase [Phycisphaerae bacterium]